MIADLDGHDSDPFSIVREVRDLRPRRGNPQAPALKVEHPAN
jgi:hypothetical protein